MTLRFTGFMDFVHRPEFSMPRKRIKKFTAHGACSTMWLVSSVKKETPWPESASELYRPGDRRLSAKLVPTFADRGCHVVGVTEPYGRYLGFLDRSRYFSAKQLLSCTHEAEWAPFQNNYLSENW
jgi:hypothetical protein